MKQLTAATACETCRHEPRVGSTLSGYRVCDYVDGIADWKAAGLPTQGAAKPDQRVIDGTRSNPKGRRVWLIQN